MAAHGGKPAFLSLHFPRELLAGTLRDTTLNSLAQQDTLYQLLSNVHYLVFAVVMSAKRILDGMCAPSCGTDMVHRSPI